MATTINQVDVLNVLHNLLGHRVNPGGTDDDLKRFVQEAYDYAWRYHKWNFSLKTAAVASDGLLPTDMDYEGYRAFDGLTETDLETTVASSSGSQVAVIWDSALGQYKLTPATETTITYQYTPPTLGTDAAGAVPFPSARVIALGAFVYAKKAENPTRADVQQEWDMFHTELDRLVARSYNALRRRPVHYLDAAGTFVGDVGA